MGHGTSSALTRNCAGCGKPLGRLTFANSLGEFHAECHDGAMGPYARIARLEAALKIIALRSHEVTLTEPVNWSEVANTFVGVARGALDDVK